MLDLWSVLIGLFVVLSVWICTLACIVALFMCLFKKLVLRKRNVA